MKKRICTWLLAVSMVASLLTLPAGAASTVKFSDVTDSYTATAIETLRLMGVLDGYGDGTFRPDGILTRAQFCKMAVYAMDGSGELGRYSTVTIFPDVKPSYWAAGYINMAAKKGIIAGFADGQFKPNQTVSAGQAVTILMRGLGYKDEDLGGVWPQSYMAEAETCGLLDGTGITSAYAGLTRGQAARLFLNLFEADTGKGTAVFSYTVGNAEVYLTAVDGGKGTMTAGGKAYPMAHPVTSTSLIGSKGKVVTNAKGEILTFLLVTGSSGVSNAAVIIGTNGSTAGLEALAGSSAYTIYKNGIPATAADLKRYDVATYSAATNAILVSDTRMSVYYENCSPSPAEPTTITVLDGVELNVLPTAVESLSKFKPGQQMTLLLTADGQVAGAVENSTGARTNAVAYVDESGELNLICGGSLVPLAASGKGYAGQVVTVSSSKSGGSVSLNLKAVSGGVSGDLNAAAGTLGGKKLADNVLVFSNGQQAALGSLGQTTIRESRIAYARSNWDGKIDLIVLDNGLDGDMVYGRAIVTKIYDETGAVDSQTIAIEYGAGQQTKAVNSGNSVNTGAWVAAGIKTSSQGTLLFSSFTTMSKLSNVSSGAWIGKTAVNFGGRTYEVPSDVGCYNASTNTWFNSMDEAKAYGGTMNLYVHDGVVRIVEVKN